MLETSKLQDVYYITFKDDMLKTLANKHILEKIRTNNFSCKRNVVEPVHLRTGITTYFCCIFPVQSYSGILTNAMNSTKYTVISWFIS